MSDKKDYRVIQVSFDVLVDSKRNYEDFIDCMKPFLKGKDYIVIGHSFVDDMTESYDFDDISPVYDPYKEYDLNLEWWNWYNNLSKEEMDEVMWDDVNEKIYDIVSTAVEKVIKENGITKEPQEMVKECMDKLSPNPNYTIMEQAIETTIDNWM